MSGEGDDRGLRDAFARLREADAASAPAFETLLDEPRARPPRPIRGRRGIAWIAAAAILLLVAVVTLRPWEGTRSPTREEALAMAREISSWRAPTDAIAEIATPGLPEGVPSLEYTSLTLPGSPPEAVATPRRSRQNR